MGSYKNGTLLYQLTNVKTNTIIVPVKGIICSTNIFIKGESIQLQVEPV